MSCVRAIGTAIPSFRVDQSAAAEFMIKAMGLDARNARRLKAVFRSSGIATRYSVLSDYNRQDGYAFYADNKTLEPFPTTADRMKVYRENACPLSVDAANNAFQQVADIRPEDVTHLITVSCTGMYAPGLDIDLVKKLSLKPSVHRTCINFMGCYAAISALRVADSFCRADENATVLIVCTELCSLHFQREPTDDNLLANALFGDGSASVIMQQTTRSPALNVISFYSSIKSNGEQDMAWTIGDKGFGMKLTSYVPDLIKNGIKDFAHQLLSQKHLTLSDIRYFAIHPGGKKILECIEQELEINKDVNAPAYSILNNFGNMSSPSVLFVLSDVWKKASLQDDENYILSFAFGPGLTFESMLLKTTSI